MKKGKKHCETYKTHKTSEDNLNLVINVKKCRRLRNKITNLSWGVKRKKN